MGKTRFVGSGVYGKVLGTVDSSGVTTDRISASGEVMHSGKPLNTKSETVVFDSIGAAGVYTGDITLPAHAIIENIIVHNVQKCNNVDTALMEVGDYSDATTAIDADGFFAAIDVKTALDAGESIDFYRTGGKHGAYLPYTTNAQNAASKVNKRYSATARIIRGALTTAGTASTEGKQLMTVVYSVPATVSATFVAAD